MVRNLVRGVIIVIAAALAIPGTVAADTVPGVEPVDVYLVSAPFSFRERGLTWSGIAQLEDERVSGRQNVSFFFSADGTSHQCDAGTPEDPADDYTSQAYIEFFATDAVVKRVSVPTALASGSFFALLSGTRVTLDACTGEIVRSKSERHSFKVDVTADGLPETSEDVSVVDNGDGTCTQVTQRAAFVSADGVAELDGNTVTVSGANLQHVTLTPQPIECA
jgi:hypothetical protein